MNLKQLVAGAAIGCTLGVAGIGMGSGIADAAPLCNPEPGVQCGPGGGPGGPPPGAGPAVPAAHPATSAGPTVPAIHPATSTGPTVPAIHLGTSAGRTVPVGHPATSTGRADPGVHLPETSVVRTITIGDHRGIRRTTTGAGGSTAPHGVTDCRRGAGARHRRRSGTDRCQPRGDRRLRPSTTSASTSNRCGTPATTNGVSDFFGIWIPLPI